MSISFDKYANCFDCAPFSPRWEPLTRDASVAVSARHGFGEDALLLAAFAAPRPRERVCDLGTGCGVLPLWWCVRQAPPARIDAVELQPEAAALARLTVERAGLTDTVTVHAADLRRWREFLPPGGMDAVVMNPPYFPEGSGKVSADPSRRITRHEGAGCALPEAMGAAAGLLREGGRFCLCHRPERLADVFEALRAVRLEPKRLQFVYRDPAGPPWLFLCEGRRGGAPGLTVLPPLDSRRAAAAFAASIAPSSVEKEAAL